MIGIDESSIANYDPLLPPATFVAHESPEPLNSNLIEIFRDSGKEHQM